MDFAQLSRELFELNTIIDSIVFIGGFHPEHTPPDEVRDFLDMSEDEELMQMGIPEDIVQDRDADELWDKHWRGYDKGEPQ